MNESPQSALCPSDVQEELIRYIYDGVPLGDFLEAVVSDKLIESFSRADSNNMEMMPHICAWVYAYMPISLRGPENYFRHLQAKAEERLNRHNPNAPTAEQA